jgi:hypothetical protein
MTHADAIIAFVEQATGRRLSASEIRLALQQAWLLGDLDAPPDRPVAWDVMAPSPGG